MRAPLPTCLGTDSNDALPKKSERGRPEVLPRYFYGRGGQVREVGEGVGHPTDARSPLHATLPLH